MSNNDTPKGTPPKVGDTVWLYDANRGRSARTHWHALKIVDDTRDSWILGSRSRGYKVDKATGLLCGGDLGALRRKVEFSRAAVEDDVWRGEHRQRVIRAVEGAGVETLKAIDDLLTERARTGTPS